jgi:hypothetical protein
MRQDQRYAIAVPPQQKTFLTTMFCPSDQTAPRTELTAEVLGRFGSARIRVYGSSMLPSIRPGDEIELRSTSFQQISVGDVVAYAREKQLFVHRVVRRDSKEAITSGDTLPCADAPISQSEFLGVVVSVFRNGRRVEQKSSLVQRAAAALFRRSQTCAALFLKFSSLPN